MTEAHDLLRRIAECSHAMSVQSGEPAVDMAGHTLSFLAAHPEHIERYMAEGNELWLDGTITFHGGCLSYRANDGQIRMPQEIRSIQEQ
jgi:hypothetical protein